MGDPYKRLRGEPVVFHLANGRSIAGTVWAAGRGVVELRAGVELVGQRAVSLDGATCIPTIQVAFYQRVSELPVATGARPAAVA